MEGNVLSPQDNSTFLVKRARHSFFGQEEGKMRARPRVCAQVCECVAADVNGFAAAELGGRHTHAHPQPPHHVQIKGKEGVGSTLLLSTDGHTDT